MTIPETTKHVVDASALTISGLSFFAIISDWTAILSLVWIMIRLYETRTVQNLLKRHKKQKKIIQESVEDD